MSNLSALKDLDHEAGTDHTHHTDHTNHTDHTDHTDHLSEVRKFQRHLYVILSGTW